MSDIEILEDMRDNIYGAMQFEDDYQVSDLEEKQFNALNLAIKHLRKTKLIKNNYISKDKIKELFKKLNKIKSRTDGKVNAWDYMILGDTTRATGRFINLDYIEKILFDEDGYSIGE